MSRTVAPGVHLVALFFALIMWIVSVGCGGMPNAKSQNGVSIAHQQSLTVNISATPLATVSGAPVIDEAGV